MRSHLKSYFKNNWGIILFVLLLSIVYNQWIIPNGNLVSGDWIYHSRQSLLSFFSIPQIWTTYWGTGTIEIMPTFSLFKLLYGILSVAFEFAISERILFFWSILIFYSVGIFILGKEIYGDDQLSIFFFGILFAFNTFIISVQTGFVTYANVYALSPLVFYSYIKLFEDKPTLKKIAFSSFMLQMCSYYEPRGLIAMLYMMAIYTVYVLIFNRNKASIIVGYLCSNLLFILFNVYWIAPKILSASATLVPSLGQVFVPFNTMINVLSMQIYAWESSVFHGFNLTPFHKVSYQPIYFIFTLMVFSISLYKIKRGQKVIINFLFFSSLIGIFLLKQQNEPFGNFYEWMFRNVPTFNLFRESNKFIVFFLPISLVFGFSVSSLVRMFKTIRAKICITVIITILLLVNTVPIFTKEIHSLFENITIPNDYNILNQFILGQNDYFRILVVPSDVSWISYSNSHPKISAISTVYQSWNYTQNDVVQNNQKRISIGNINQIFTSSFSDEFIDASSIKYIVVPLEEKRKSDNIYNVYGGRSEYIKLLDSVSYLKKIDIGSVNLDIYENTEFKPHLYITNKIEQNSGNKSYQEVEMTTTTPSMYKLVVSTDHLVYLNFSESYDPNWKLFVGKFDWLKVVTDKSYTSNGPEHYKNWLGLNSYRIDPDAICNCKSVGKTNLEVTLYYLPQSFFNVGMVISSVSGLGVVLILMANYFYNKK